jgi:hypothetical protein
VCVCVCASECVCWYPGWVLSDEEFKQAQTKLRRQHNMPIDTGVEITLHGIKGINKLIVIGMFDM